MKLKYFCFDQGYGDTGHVIKLIEADGLDVSMSSFHPSPELIAIIEKEAEAEIVKRRSGNVTA